MLTVVPIRRGGVTVDLRGCRITAYRWRLGLILFVFLLAGCAPWSGHGVIAYPHQKLRIAVLPVQSSVVIKKLKDIETVPPSAEDLPVEEERIRQEMQKVTEEMTRSIEARLNSGPYFEVVPHEQVAEALAAGGVALENAPLTAGQIKSLAKALKADAVLIIRLSGYGRLKGRWVAYLIGTGVAEGVVEGAVAGGAVRNLWVGLAVALEEIGQEVLTWGGGSFLFNRYYAPVTIEGELVSAMDGERVWSHTAFDSIDRKGLKKLPEEERKKKEVQLEVTAKKAEKEFMDSLEKAASRNVLSKPLDAGP